MHFGILLLTRTPEEVVKMIQNGEFERFTLHQATLLDDQAPDKSDVGYFYVKLYPDVILTLNVAGVP